jgi:hypothetical protein
VAAAQAAAVAPSLIVTAAPILVTAVPAAATATTPAAVVSSAVAPGPAGAFAIAWSGPASAPVVSVEATPDAAFAATSGVQATLKISSVIDAVEAVAQIAALPGEATQPPITYLVPVSPETFGFLTPIDEDDEPWLVPVGSVPSLDALE